MITFKTFLYYIDKTNEYTLKDTLFKGIEYVDTPGDWWTFTKLIKKEHYNNSIEDYYKNNMSEEDFLNLIKLFNNKKLRNSFIKQIRNKDGLK